MESPLLLTAGYGKRSISDVIDLLQGHGVRFLVDIRSAPWSRHHPDFAHDALKQHMQGTGTAHLFMGQGLATDRPLAGRLSLFDTPPGKAVESRGRYRPVEE